ncbi:peptide-methionine (R)-S-oxide reductase MsrB [Mesorhizobium sp. INR15]|uniref:peptide-methionine (R)-S-oxide reductase MsrB n=1 Tax=Mesorhizobium sp. INR15 TaxID=2654248 RepID=UPI0018967ED5|nr:peptide-methionine (R)-S-oxide reductase MsrB [Mesorhizobium sp. INR15]QPC91832.1 peptide-methionine (R)-S-oxide reductase MsrB [Mesorhizobium sp. INR15]
MVTRRSVLMNSGAGLAAVVLGWRIPNARAAKAFEVTHTDAEWKKLLGAKRYVVLRQSGTEQPYSSPLLKEHRKGTFTCAGCSLDAFSSETKFDSGTGWPSFWQPLTNAIVTDDDKSLGMDRTAVSCRRCGGHLGHVFDDGPKPTGLRYCMNGLALSFRSATA